MTKKDHELIAAAIREARATVNAHNHPLTASDSIHAVVTELSAALKRDNGRFDKDRFWLACFK